MYQKCINPLSTGESAAVLLVLQSPAAPQVTGTVQHATTQDNTKKYPLNRLYSDYLQGFNAQAVATEDQIIIAAEVSNDGGDTHQFQPMIQAASDTLHEAGIIDGIGVVVADAGYLHDNNLAPIEGGPEVLIATRNRRKVPVEQCAPRGRIPKSATPRERMDRKLSTKRGQQLYRKRSAMIEPVFGQIKHNRGQRTFLLRGLDGVNLEWKLWCTTHNLLKMFRATTG